MRTSALLLLFISLTAAAPGRFERVCTRSDQGRSHRGLDCGGAFFEAFPASGAGTFGVCSTTAPTGAHGETLSFSRASNGTCTRTASGGLATTNIQPGDVIVLSSNQPRVEYDGNGTLGLLVEAAGTNVSLRSQEMENAVWTNVSGTCTVTADAVVAPDGTTTADRINCAAGAFNARGQAVTTAGAGVRVLTGYVKDLASSNGVTLRMVGTGDSAGDTICEALTIATGSWTRVQCVSGNYGAGLTAISVRIFNSTVNSARNFDGYVWGVQLELGAYATSYIPTTSAAVTRAAEVPSFALTGTSQVISMAATVTAEWPFNTAPTSAVLSMDGANASTIYNPAATTFRFLSGGVSATGTTPNAAGPWRVYGYADGSATNVSWAGTAGTPGGAGAAASRWGTSLGICEGTPAGIAGGLNAICSRICVDPNPARCR